MPDADVMSQEDPQALERELRALEGRDLQLWSLVGLIAAILAAGFAALLVPHLFREAGSAFFTQQNLPVLFSGLLVLLLLLAIYMVQQRVGLTRTRRDLTRRLLQSERTARIDPVTGIFNRRNLEETLNREMARAQRTGSRLSIVMLSVDGFQALQARFGHVVSERLLADTARLLQRNFRASDCLLRSGVDEFLAILPDTDRREAQVAVDRLQGTVAQWNRRNQEFGYELALSPGIAQFVPDASTLESLLEAADAEICRQRAARAPHNALTAAPAGPLSPS